MIRLLIFDLDGTLVDSMTDITLSMNATLRALGLHPLNRGQIQSFVGDGIRLLVKRCLQTQKANPSLDELEKALGIYFHYYDMYCVENTRPYPGVPETLQELSQYLKVVLSNKSEYYTRKILQALRLSSYFEAVIGGDTFDYKKPDPRVIQNLLQRYALSASQALIVGDSPQDIQCGKAAGIHTCAVLYGYRSMHELSGADFFIKEIHELPAKLTEMNIGEA